MEKEFNVTGSCNPIRHYMVDISHKFAEVMGLIEKGKYFAINRPRQYGKTTLLNALFRGLTKQKYITVFLSFEGMGDAFCENETTFAAALIRMIARELKLTHPDVSQKFEEATKNVTNLETLSIAIGAFAGSVDRAVVVLIDEVDKSSDNQLFLSFLGMLRDKYLRRERGEPTFQSVVLAGVYDVKSLKLKLRPDAEAKLNSPWNIAADFNVDMSFNPAEIKTMLTAYAAEKGVAMDVDAIAERVHYYTSGYPFLVSKICKDIDEEETAQNPAYDPKRWTVSDVDWAFRYLTREDYTTTNFDDLVKNLENHPDLYRVIESVLFGAEKEGVPFSVKEPVINLGVLYGMLRNNHGKAVIHNRVYEQILADYIRAKKFVAGKLLQPEVPLSYYRGDRLDVETIVLRFQAFIKEHYSARDSAFLEREGRLVFMSFLKPVVNGRGFIHKEPVIGPERRIDLVVTYGAWEDVIETKIWRGQAYHERGLEQLSEYLDFKGLKVGYLLIFNFNTDKEYKAERVRFKDKDLFVVWT